MTSIDRVSRHLRRISNGVQIVDGSETDRRPPEPAIQELAVTIVRIQYGSDDYNERVVVTPPPEDDPAEEEFVSADPSAVAKLGGWR